MHARPIQDGDRQARDPVLCDGITWGVSRASPSLGGRPCG